MSTIDISGLDKAEVLAAAYNASQPLGLGFLQPGCGESMTPARAAQYLDRNPSGYFDYLQGRVMKVDLSGDDVDPRLFDRDNGPGAFATVISRLRQASTAA